MPTSGFLAMLSRMKYINRWGLMRNTRSENVSEHSLEVALIAHMLAVLRNRRFGGNVNPERAALIGMMHDAGEILTGDMPTPIKYYSPQLKEAYHQVEQVAADRLIALLPPDLREEYRALMTPGEEDKEVLRLVKAADKLSALIKCVEERRAGSGEFLKAEQSIRAGVEQMDLPEVNCFLREMLPAFELTLDEQTAIG